MNRVSFGCVSLLALATSFASARPAEEADLTWRPVVGQTSAYRLTSTTQVNMGDGPTEVVFSLLTRETIKSVETDKVTTESVASEMKMRFGQNEMDPSMMGNQTGDGKMTTVFDRRGQFISMSGGTAMPSNPRVDLMRVFLRPETKVKVGDSWEKEWKADAAKGIRNSKARWTLEGKETVMGVTAWKITHLFAELEGNQAMSASSTIWLDVKTNDLVRTEGVWENVRFNEMMPPVTTSIVLEIVRP
ncbi:MAG: hypothetical protein MUC92_05310 [Fimbriimonadaceae bacterium]|nr:hypothetical protein [Fimbriimonadaceae bacterium]